MGEVYILLIKSILNKNIINNRYIVIKKTYRNEVHFLHFPTLIDFLMFLQDGYLPIEVSICSSLLIPKPLT